MPNFICVTCGTQYLESASAPEHCPICEDERQYIGHNGQQWTTLEDLRAERANLFRQLEPNLTGIGSEPRFAIGQRALLIQTPAGNVLWDCISLIDEATVERINALGGLTAIAISHPHFYSSMVAWSEAFGGLPIYLHADNRPYVQRPAAQIQYWDSETFPLGDGLTLIRCGGHFAGSTVLHWAAGADGRGALLTGDTIQIVADRRYVSFMYSYPNMIPLRASAVRRIAAAVGPFAFDRIYNGWYENVVDTDGNAAVRRSAERYIAAIEDVN